MTREEAIEILHFQTFVVDFQTGKALEMAISALRQQETVTDRHQMTNADRIRAMTDEEMLQWITAGENCVMTICDHICGGECNAIATLKKSAVVACKEIVMKWLQQPAGEEEA